MIAYLLPTLYLDVFGAPMIMDARGGGEPTNPSIPRRRTKLNLFQEARPPKEH
jgi:hypothetical protein